MHQARTCRRGCISRSSLVDECGHSVEANVRKPGVPYDKLSRHQEPTIHSHDIDHTAKMYFQSVGSIMYHMK